MKIFLSVDANERVQSWGSTRGSQSDIQLEVLDTHEVLKNPFVFKYINGTLQKDEAYQQQLIAEQNNRISDSEKIDQLEKETADLWYALMTGGIV